jgi:hypothetical protein
VSVDSDHGSGGKSLRLGDLRDICTFRWIHAKYEENLTLSIFYSLARGAGWADAPGLLWPVPYVDGWLGAACAA